VVLTIDEYEALRLGDFEGLNHEKAAEKMGISRQTFGRIIESAHHKVADALVNARALRIRGGDIEIGSYRLYFCPQCGYSWFPERSEEEPRYCEVCGASGVCRSREISWPSMGSTVIDISLVFCQSFAVILWWKWWCLPFPLALPLRQSQ